MFRIILPIIALSGVAVAGKRRRIVKHLSGKTPTRLEP